MALWKPYAQVDEPLDLSQNALKSEDASPHPSFASPQLPPPVQGATAGYATYPDTRYSYGNFYQPAAPFVPPAVPYIAPASAYVATSISPDSTGSCLTQPILLSSPESGLHVSDTESLSGDMEYQIFEKQAFQDLAKKNGGFVVGNHPQMKRDVQTSQSNDSYRQQRERNNLAAKQSRNRRKLREIRLAFQVNFLKKKIAVLKARMAASVCTRCAGRM